MKTYNMWTDAGDEDDITADTLDEAVAIASCRIPAAAWRDGAWAIVRDSETGEQQEVEP